MIGFITKAALKTIVSMPVTLPQTELRRSRTLTIASIPLQLGEELEIKSLVLSSYRNLSPGNVPEYLTGSLGILSVGLYFGRTVTSPLALAVLSKLGTSMVNPYKACKCKTPGVYSIIVSNNTTNMDYSVAVTGSVKIYV